VELVFLVCGRHRLQLMRDTLGGNRMPQQPPFDLADDHASARPPVRLLNLIIREALSANATRIALEVDLAHCLVRFEHAGSWIEVMRVPGVVGGLLMNRLRIMAALDRVGGKREQTGDIHVQIDGKEIMLGLALQATDGASQQAIISIPSVAA
jgi:type II secretory ATPase GspE/PulE/Tfp pilus assembly ATPase PilB-like protein